MTEVREVNVKLVERDIGVTVLGIDLFFIFKGEMLVYFSLLVLLGILVLFS